MAEHASKSERTAAARAGRAGAPRQVPRWAITTLSVLVVLGGVGILRPRHQPRLRLLSERDRRRVLGARALGPARRRALSQSLQPFAVGFGLAILVGVPLGLVIGRFRFAEAALGIYVTAGYAMPLSRSCRS